jgi:hypothetical protein
MKAKSPHLTLTLSPPIRMGAEREQQAGSIHIRSLAGHRPVQEFNARIASEKMPSVCHERKSDSQFPQLRPANALAPRKVFV